MADPKIVNPHDSFFHAAMEHPPVAIDFLNHHLPEKIRQGLDVESLRLLPTTYVDTNLRNRFSDVVFHCKLADKPAYIGILVEHQSKPDKLLQLRVMQYLFGLLNSINRRQPGQLLPAVYTLVFYHGKETPYPYSLNLLDCFDDPLNIMDDVFQRPLSLIDVNQLSDEELLQQKWVGPVSMKHIRAENITPYAMAIFEALTRWPLDHPETVELLKLLLNYLFNVGNISDVDAFIEVDMNRLSGPIRSEVMTIAEKLREKGMQEGERKGEQKGLEKAALMMLREGVEMAFIAKVTSLSVADIERLQASLEVRD
ncbi:MAG: Rpn family recombination-promoting nuclease/putative transposase [Exilibacterium sp.]